MRAAILTAFNGPQGVSVIPDAPTPPVGNTDVLVRIWGGGLNPADLKTTEGMLPYLNLPYVMGHDLIGDVVGIGHGVVDFDLGDVVVGNLGFAGGAFAELASVPSKLLAKLPDDVPPGAAAVLPVIGLTAMQAVRDIGNVASGDRVLIHGASGSVGSLASQLAKAAGAYVYGTGSGPKAAQMREDGVDTVIDYRSMSFTDIIAPGSLDFVLDTVGGETLRKSASLLKPSGILVSIVTSDVVSLAALAGVKGKFLVIDTSGTQIAELLRMVGNGRLRLRVGRTFALRDIRQAFQSLDRGDGGKILVVVDETSPIGA